MSDDFLVIDTNSAVKPTKVVSDKPPVLQLLGEEHPFLKKKIDDYNTDLLPNASMSKIVASMKETLMQYGAIGLAANQCGINERLFVIGTDVFQMACINPKILNTEGDQEKMREGCLSFPGLTLTVPRYKRILVEYFDENGKKEEVWLDGMTAQSFQHELDHLNGICYDSYVKPLAMKMAREKQKKLMKKFQRKFK